MSNEACSCCGNDSCPEIVGLRAALAEKDAKIKDQSDEIVERQGVLERAESAEKEALALREKVQLQIADARADAMLSAFEAALMMTGEQIRFEIKTRRGDSAPAIDYKSRAEAAEREVLALREERDEARKHAMESETLRRQWLEVGDATAMREQALRVELAELGHNPKQFIEECKATIHHLREQILELKTPLKDWDAKLSEKNAALSNRNAELAAQAHEIKTLREERDDARKDADTCAEDARHYADISTAKDRIISEQAAVIEVARKFYHGEFSSLSPLGAAILKLDRSIPAPHPANPTPKEK